MDENKNNPNSKDNSQNPQNEGGRTAQSSPKPVSPSQEPSVKKISLDEFIKAYDEAIKKLNQEKEELGQKLKQLEESKTKYTNLKNELSQKLKETTDNAEKEKIGLALSSFSQTLANINAQVSAYKSRLESIKAISLSSSKTISEYIESLKSNPIIQRRILEGVRSLAESERMKAEDKRKNFEEEKKLSEKFLSLQDKKMDRKGTTFGSVLSNLLSKKKALAKVNATFIEYEKDPELDSSDSKAQKERLEDEIFQLAAKLNNYMDKLDKKDHSTSKMSEYEAISDLLLPENNGIYEIDSVPKTADKNLKSAQEEVDFYNLLEDEVIKMQDEQISPFAVSSKEPQTHTAPGEPNTNTDNNNAKAPENSQAQEPTTPASSSQLSPDEEPTQVITPPVLGNQANNNSNSDLDTLDKALDSNDEGNDRDDDDDQSNLPIEESKFSKFSRWFKSFGLGKFLVEHNILKESKTISSDSKSDDKDSDKQNKDNDSQKSDKSKDSEDKSAPSSQIEVTGNAKGFATTTLGRELTTSTYDRLKKEVQERLNNQQAKQQAGGVAPQSPSVQKPQSQITDPSQENANLKRLVKTAQEKFPDTADNAKSDKGEER